MFFFKKTFLYSPRLTSPNIHHKTNPQTTTTLISTRAHTTTYSWRKSTGLRVKATEDEIVAALSGPGGGTASPQKAAALVGAQKSNERPGPAPVHPTPAVPVAWASSDGADAQESPAAAPEVDLRAESPFLYQESYEAPGLPGMSRKGSVSSLRSMYSAQSALSGDSDGSSLPVMEVRVMVFFKNIYITDHFN
jgi:hypothetical protein